MTDGIRSGPRMFTMRRIVIPFGRLTDDFGINDIVIKTEKMF